MAVHIIKGETNKLSEDLIVDAYTLYLNNRVEVIGNASTDITHSKSTLMTYEEFREYYILSKLGRSIEFTDNMVRDYQSLNFEKMTINIT